MDKIPCVLVFFKVAAGSIRVFKQLENNCFFSWRYFFWFKMIFFSGGMGLLWTSSLLSFFLMSVTWRDHQELKPARRLDEKWREVVSYCDWQQSSAGDWLRSSACLNIRMELKILRAGPSFIDIILTMSLWVSRRKARPSICWTDRSRKVRS